MDVGTMHIEFRLTLDKLDSSAYPGIMVEQVDYFLNEAQNRFIKTRYGRNNVYKSGFEEIQKRTEDLTTLVKVNYCTVTPYIYYENAYKVSLSNMFLDEAKLTPSTSKYMFFVRGESQNVLSDTCKKYLGVRLTNHDDMTLMLNDPFKRPYKQEAVALFEDGNIIVLTDGTFSIGNFRVSFIKKPVEITYGVNYPSPVANVDCELPEHTHKEIVALAAQIALENIESQRLNTNIPVVDKTLE